MNLPPVVNVLAAIGARLDPHSKSQLKGEEISDQKNTESVVGC